jgi:hypothetical protein
MMKSVILMRGVLSIIDKTGTLGRVFGGRLWLRFLLSR